MYPGDFHHRCIVDFLWWDSSLSTVLSFGLWKNPSVHCDLHRGRTCQSSLQLSLHSNLHDSSQPLLQPNLLIHEIHWNWGTCLWSSSRSTNVFMPSLLQLTSSFASIVMINVLDRVHDQSSRSWSSSRSANSFAKLVAIELKYSFCDHVRDHTSLSCPLQPSLRSDVQRAHWS